MHELTFEFECAGQMFQFYVLVHQDDTFEVSKRRKRHSQVVHSGKLIQPYLRRISHGNIDSLMLHFDLLDQLKKQISESNLGS